MNFSWAADYPDLRKVCERFNLLELTNPQQVRYKHFNSIRQDGPQCGLVALAMLMESPTATTVNELLKQAIESNYSYNGEMFSTKEMCQLASKNLPNKVTLYEGSIDSDEIKCFLLGGGTLLVPYDCDKNYTPCNLKGHKAHWALVVGIIETSEKTYVIARHGQSSHMGIWNLTELSESNGQLEEFSPSRKSDNLTYKLPEGGICGPNGIKNKSMCIWPYQ